MGTLKRNGDSFPSKDPETINIKAEVYTDKDSGEAVCSMESIGLIVRSSCPDKFSCKDDLVISKITEGVSNILYKVSPACNEPSKAVIVRIYGVGRDLLIDENEEAVLFSELANVGFGPPILGKFLNGRVEGYLHCRSMAPIDMCQTKPIDFVSSIAREMARMHNLNIVCRGDNVLWDRLHAWGNKAQKITFSDDDSKQDVLISLDVPLMVKEAQWVESVLKENSGSLDSSLTVGLSSSHNSTVEESQRFYRRMMSHVSFCHLDVCSTNIMWGDEEPERVHLIDYEYSGYSPRGFDLANHWYEYSGFETEFSHAYPSQEVKRHFLLSYCAALVPPLLEGPKIDGSTQNLNLNAISKEVERYVAVSDLIWYFWAIIKASDSQIDFDYLEYAGTRLRSYKFHKDWVTA